MLFKNTIISSELKNHIGQTAAIRGRLHTVRTVGSGLAFVIIRDRDGLSQAVVEDAEEIKKLDGMLLGSIITATGTVAQMSKGKFPFELQKSTIHISKPIKHPSPIDISKEEIKAEGDTIHENKVVYLRHPRQMNIFKIAAIAEKNMRKFFDNNDFTQINSPKIIAFPTEGGAEIFEVDYFDKKVYLAQSPQFYKQMMVPVFEKVYEIGRAYRAEKSNTNRHMSEILMLDAEMGFIDDFDDIIDLVQEFFKFAVNETRKEGEIQLTRLGAVKPILAEKFPRITVAELHKLMLEQTGEDYTKDLDVSPAEERFICEYSAKNWGSEAVFVTDFPRSDAKFYHHQNEKNPESADRADILFRGVELATLTRREVDYDKLVNQIKSKGFDPNHPGLKYYLEAFKYGMPEEGGFGFGIARFIQKLIGLENAKEAELFPRDVNRITP